MNNYTGSALPGQAPINNYGTGQTMQESNQVYERDRRVRLREQERSRRNMTQGNQPALYGHGEGALGYEQANALPLYDAQRFQDQQQQPGIWQQIVHEQAVPQAWPMQQEPVGGAMQYQGQDYNQQLKAFGLPEQRDSLNDREAAVGMAAQQALRQSHAHSSKSKLNLAQAKELDQNINKNYSSQQQQMVGLLQLGGGQLDERSREQLEKRQKQQEYQMMLDSQRAAKELKGSPGRLQERLNSARRMGAQMQEQAVGGQASPNKRRMLRSTSSSGPKQPGLQQHTNILGQPMLPAQQQYLQKMNEEYKNQRIPLTNRRSGSASRAMEAQNELDKPLIAGALNQIGDNEQRQQEAKLRKQREYREYLDMQKNQGKKSIGGGVAQAQRPPIPSGGGQYQQSNNLASGRPPSGGQRSQHDQNFPPSSRDPQYERRKHISDQVFEQLMQKKGSNNQIPQQYPGAVTLPEIQQSSQQASYPRPPSKSDSRRSLSRQNPQEVDYGQNVFYKMQLDDSEHKQREADKKKEYAQELQNQIQAKKQQRNLPPKSSNSHRQLPQIKSPERQTQQQAPAQVPNYQVLNQFRQQFGADGGQQQNLPQYQQQQLNSYPQGAMSSLDQQPIQPGFQPLINQQKPVLQFQPQQISFSQADQAQAPSLLRPPYQNYNHEIRRSLTAQQEPAVNLGARPALERAQTMAEVDTDLGQMENDPVYQQILQRKREEYRLKMEQDVNQGVQQHGGGQAGYGNMGAAALNQPSQRPEMAPQKPAEAAATANNGLSEADLQRHKREAYKRQLDEQMKRKEAMDHVKTKAEVDQQELFEKGQPNSSIQHALPMEAPKEEYNVDNVRAGLRRTDITTENQRSDTEAQKRNAYKEELRLQMEQQLKSKADEKARLKKEEEEFERGLEKQRHALENKERRELIKEGKDPSQFQEKGRKMVNRAQFDTSEEIEQRAKMAKENVQNPKESSSKEEEVQEAQIQMKQKLEEELRQRQAQKQPDTGPEKPADPPVYQPFKMPETSQQLAGNGPPTGLPQLQQPWNPHLADQLNPSLPPHLLPPQIQTPSSIDQSQIHQRLLDDQAKMIDMYQQALQQILDFRQEYFKQAQDMQVNLVRERERMADQQQQMMEIRNSQNVPGLGGQFGGPFGTDIRKQENEIEQLRAVKDQLGRLVNGGQAGQGNNAFTNIINPQVQTNLNDLIKTQRDKIVRMSESLRFGGVVQGAAEKSPGRGRPFENQGQYEPPPIYGQELPRAAQLDESLSSHSKLIRVPNQFANKLKEKAENFEQARMRNISSEYHHAPGMVEQLKGNVPHFDYAAQSPTNKSSATGLYQTWNQPGGSTEHPSAPRNDRANVNSISPIKNQIYAANNPMQGSLAGNSQLQFFNEQSAPGVQDGSANQIEEARNQDGRALSPIPLKNMAPGGLGQGGALSPSSRQSLVAGGRSRPQTNQLVHAHETILEQPEREQNMGDTNDYNTEDIKNAKHFVPQKAETRTDKDPLDNQRNRQMKYQQSEQTKVAERILQPDSQPVHSTQHRHTIDTDYQEFNNRDEEMTQYSKFGRRSKVTEGSKGDSSQQIQQNLQFIEHQVNLGAAGPPGRNNYVNFQGINSNGKSPFSNDRKESCGLPLSPSNNQFANVGKGSQSKQNSGIPSSTEKSFFKQPTQNPNLSQMANTGMAGAKPMITGSSFYNATMAKTKQQELNQQEELQKQLQKIFSTGDNADQPADEERPATQDSKDQSIKQKPAGGHGQLDDSEYLMNTSNINIAQSVAMSMEMKDGQVQKPSTGGGAAVGSGLGAPMGLMKTSFASGSNAQQPNSQQNTSNIIDSQYNWLMQNNVINEQQEYEQSKSREGTEPSAGKSNMDQQLSSRQSHVHITEADNEDEVESKYGQTTKQSEAIWDDPDINASQSAAQMPAEQSCRIDEAGSLQLEGTTSTQQQLQGIQADGMDSYKESLELPYDDASLASGHPEGKWQAKNSKARSHNKPHTFAPKEEVINVSIHDQGSSTAQAASPLHQDTTPQRLHQHFNASQIQSDYNIALPSAASNIKTDSQIEEDIANNHLPGTANKHPCMNVSKFNLQFGSGRPSEGGMGRVSDPNHLLSGSKTGISGLNLGQGLFSEGEPTSAGILKQDKELHQLKMCSPNLGDNLNTLSDPAEREQHDKFIDQMYALRNSQQFQFGVQGTSNQLVAQQRLQRNLELLNRPSEGGFNTNLNSMEQSSDIYPPKMKHFNRDEIQIKEPIKGFGGSKKQLSRDSILENTPMISPNQAGSSTRLTGVGPFVVDQQSSQNHDSLETGALDKNGNGLSTKQLEQMTPSQRNMGGKLNNGTSESYKLKVEENFEESLKRQREPADDDVLVAGAAKVEEKAEAQEQPRIDIESKTDDGESRPSKLKLYSCHKESAAVESEAVQFQAEVTKRPDAAPPLSVHRSPYTPNRGAMQRPSDMEGSSQVSRPYTNVPATKQKELDDLARLIQQATGSVNHIVESSQQFKMTRQFDKSAKLRAQQHAKSKQSLGAATVASKKPGQTQASESSPQRNPVGPFEQAQCSEFTAQSTNMNQLDQRITEESQNNQQILSNIDQIISNIEKHQLDSQKLQSKFSSNKAFVTGTFPNSSAQQMETLQTEGADAHDVPLANQAQDKILESLQQTGAIEESAHIERSGEQSAEASETQMLPQTHMHTAIVRHHNESKNSQEATLMLGKHKNLLRPSSGASAASTATKRQAAGHKVTTDGRRQTGDATKEAAGQTSTESGPTEGSARLATNQPQRPILKSEITYEK